jgi:site-specific DNA recombinase
MKVAAYLRVSTDEQAESGLSLANQREKTVGLARLHDWEMIKVIEDTVPAGTVNRDGLQRLLAFVRGRKVQAVIIYKLDRLTRSQRDLLALLDLFRRYGVRLVSVCENLDTESASGRFFIQMMGAVAEWERGTIGERTKAAMAQLRKEGKRFSRIPPFGWKYTAEGRMAAVADEQETLQMIRSLTDQGISLRRIGRELEAAGRKPRSGGKWHPKVIASLKRAA